ncbi:MAG TPA: hypothetical protein VHU41_18670, partial [Thermoanaerobaculia bacterium]|nr:hypothetical protein [Thermoanaerobaculia bacterium]
MNKAPSRMRPRDTTENAAAIAAEAHRAAGPERRLLQALELSDLLREFAKAGLRSRHPEYTEAELTAALG